MVNVLRINPADNVVTALRDLPAGAQLEATDALPIVITTEAIPFGHKVAIALIRKGDSVVKYGASIGRATRDIAPGQHVHTHNVQSVRGAIHHE